ncbi:MAG: hypothetical protein IRZ10_11745 [Thermoflavifilum sp.]|nr:hypothetical protein [Thermoflavifilum sp.]MCL6515072.1 hypothetical protein [Alicyclobacillus sp.]
MRRQSLEELLNPRRVARARRIQLQILATSPGMKRRIRRPRSDEELALLARAISDTWARWEQEGKVIRRGRAWVLRI